MRRLALGCLLTCAALVAGGATKAEAVWRSTGKAGHGVSTATMPAVGAATAVLGTCVKNISTSVVVSWPAATGPATTGYEVRRSTSAGGPFVVVGTIAGISVTSYTDITAAFATRYYYNVQAARHLWRGPPSTNATLVTLTANCR